MIFLNLPIILDHIAIGIIMGCEYGLCRLQVLVAQVAQYGLHPGMGLGSIILATCEKLVPMAQLHGYEFT